MSWLLPLEIGLAPGFVLTGAVLAMAVSFRLLRFPDLTIEGSVPLGAGVYAKVVADGGDPVIGGLFAFAAGAAAGACTASIHLRLGVNKFLAGILTTAALYSLTLRIMGGSNISLLGVSSPLRSLSSLNVRDFRVGTFVLLLAFSLFTIWVLSHVLRTKVGLRMRAGGSNPLLARQIGFRPGAYLTLGLALTNGIAACAGALLAMHQGFADVGSGLGLLIIALASMTLGERIVSRSWFSIDRFVLVAALMGSLCYQVLFAYALRLGLAPVDLKIATAGLVLLVIAIRAVPDVDLVLGDGT